MPPAGFTQVDNAGILNVDLPPLTRLLYVILRQHRNQIDGRCCPSYPRLCELLGTRDKPAARTTVANGLRQLYDAGLVAWERHGGSNCFCFPGDPDYSRVREVAQDYFSRRDAKPAYSSSARLLRKLSCATSEVAQDYSNNTKRTRRREQDDSAATQRDAPAAPSVPARANPEPTKARANESAPSKPKRSTASKASDNASEQEQGARRAAQPQPTEAGYDLMAWWCTATDNLLRGDDRRRYALGADDLLRKTDGDAERAKEWLSYRIAQGWNTDLRYAAVKYLNTWRAGDGAHRRGTDAAGARGVPRARPSPSPIRPSAATLERARAKDRGED